MNIKNLKVPGLLLALTAAALPATAQITVVNMIPNAQSNETRQDSEPNLAVNPTNTNNIAGSAFTANYTGATSTAPIFVSTNGGTTWTANNIVPSGNGSTGDISLRFAGASNFLYAGTLRGGSGLTLNILRTSNFTSTTTMSLLRSRSNVDQPYVQAGTFPTTGEDRVFVGLNDFAAASGRSATVDRTLSGTVATPTWVSARLDPRTTCGQDGPPIRSAIHPDGTIYAIYYRYRPPSGCVSPIASDVIVVRDDNWANPTPRFAALTDPGDGLAGRIVVSNVRVPFTNSSQSAFGQERFVSSNVSIAVDPNNSSRVYIAWADFPTGVAPYTLHVRRSDNRGVTWTATDLITISNATNPALAVNSDGKVAFLYQANTPFGVALASQRWETHVRRSTDLGVSWDDVTLANTAASSPAVSFIPYLGDYVHIMSVGKNFYGIFSASNFPDLANFPQGVTYQRNADFVGKVLRNVTNTANVSVSIDPFFFKIIEP
ncbi:MAG TPA: sialidase family protein [Thermoanaerobaculia bacterium]|nr:sialidase family protein [Thermoanaerobaculia bacterium]